MVPFGGWEMPLQYTGVLEEHRACREHAVVFDVSHLGTVECGGPGAFDLLQWLLTNDLRRVAPGKAQYTHLLDADDAHVVDDIIVWWVDEERFFVMPNASNTDELLAAFQDGLAHTDGEVVFADHTAGRAVLAVQGPEARALLAKVQPEAADVERFSVRRVGSGSSPAPDTRAKTASSCTWRPSGAAVWAELLDAGLVPAGLGARDTLRLEAGLPLHGHELGAGITPLQAGLGWVVGWDKDDFRGRGPLAAERERGIARRLRGIAIEGRRPAREGSRVLVDGADVGARHERQLLADARARHRARVRLRPTLEIGAAVQLDVRGPIARRAHRQAAVREAMTIRAARPDDPRRDLGAGARARRVRARSRRSGIRSRRIRAPRLRIRACRERVDRRGRGRGGRVCDLLPHVLHVAGTRRDLARRSVRTARVPPAGRRARVVR
jgi:aminomethyltransferase